MQNKQLNSSESLEAYGYRLHYNSDMGGRIDGLFFNDVPILRETLDSATAEPLQSACFPLVPFSNRIREGVFIFDGKKYQLEPNWDGDQPVIHGEAWQKSWSVTEKGEHLHLLEFEGRDWWPWHYRARQSFSLSPQGVDIKLEIENLSSDAMPAGLGFHPYFPKYSDTMIYFQSDSIWPPMDANPLQKCDAPHLSFNNARNINDYDLDHCFENLSSDIVIEQPSLGLKIIMQCIADDRTATQSHHAIVYNPKEDYFCVEPVSHITGAIGSNEIEEAVNILQKNEKLSLHVRISAENIR